MPVTVGTDSYVTLEEAQTYFDSRLYSEPWEEADEPTKEKALKMAAKAIDRMVITGRKYDPDQALAFPRWPDDTVPQEVKDAQCEEALALLDRGDSTRRKLQQQGVKSASFGKASENYFGTGARGLISQEAKELLLPWLAGPVSMK